jgi:hypothetical protein
MGANTVGHDAVVVWVGMLFNFGHLGDHFSLKGAYLLNAIEKFRYFAVLLPS